MSLAADSFAECGFSEVESVFWETGTPPGAAQEAHKKTSPRVKTALDLIF